MPSLMPWFREKKKEALTALGVTVLLGVTVGPWLASRLFSFATDMVGAAVALLVLAGLVILTPTALYWLSLLAYRGKQKAIESDPAAALARELEGFRADITEDEIALSAFEGDDAAIEEVLRVKKKLLRPEDVEFLRSQQEALRADRTGFEEQLKTKREELGRFEAEVTRSNIMQDIGGRLQKAAGRLSATNRRGMDSDVAMTALRTLAGNVASARSRLRISIARREALELPGSREVFELPSARPKALVERNQTK